VKLYAILTVALIAAGGGVIVLASLFYYPFQPNPMQYNIASESRDKNPMPVAFENATNLTNNPMDSVYGQVAAWNNNVYLLWEDSMPLGYRNYDIFIKTSTYQFEQQLRLFRASTNCSLWQ
jgi:hypothetical protein